MNCTVFNGAGLEGGPYGDRYGQPEWDYVKKADLEECVRKVIGQLKVYVVESEITESQNTVRAIVEQASF